MENETTNRSTESPDLDSQGMGFGGRLGAIFFEPRRAFEDVDRRPTWLPVYIIVCFLALGSTWVLSTRMDRETMFRKGLQMSPMARNLTEEQIQQAWSRQRDSAFAKYSGYVIAPVAILAANAVIAAAFLLVFMLLGSSPGFRKSLAVTFWGMFPAGLTAALLGILFMYLKEPDTLAVNPAENIASNLGFLVDSTKPVLKSLLGSIDLFSLWSIALLSIGFSTVKGERKLTTGKAAAGVVSLWALWVLGKAGFSAIFS